MPLSRSCILTVKKKQKGAVYVEAFPGKVFLFLFFLKMFLKSSTVDLQLRRQHAEEVLWRAISSCTTERFRLVYLTSALGHVSGEPASIYKDFS